MKFILNFSENPLSCSCENQEFWEWLKDHPRLLLAPTRLPPLNTYGGLSSPYNGKGQKILF